jgi:hypothetical protein
VQTGAVAAIVAGAMLLAMTELGAPLEELKAIINQPPSAWSSLVPQADWTVKLFGVAAFTFIASFFSEDVAGGLAGIMILLGVANRHTPDMATAVGGDFGSAAPVAQPPSTQAPVNIPPPSVLTPTPQAGSAPSPDPNE